MLEVITSTTNPEILKDPPSKTEEQQQQQPSSIGAYLLLNTLGIGEFGKVKLGKHVKTSQEVAVKLIDKKRVETAEIRDKVDREIAILKKLAHPCIVKLFDVIETEDYIGIVLDYAPGGELFEYILAHTRLEEAEARALFAQLISSVHYMHQKGVVHRDLKLENILLMDENHIMITDFGFANQAKKDDLLATCCGSPCYAAPELLAGDKYVGPPVDVWSCGVVLYAMLCGFLPFDDNNNINQLYKDITEDPLILPTHVSESAGQLLCQMLEPDPKERCTIEDVMAHPWLAEQYQVFAKTTEELESEAIDMLQRKVFVDEGRVTPLPLLLTTSSSESTSSLHTERRTTHAREFIYASVQSDPPVDSNNDECQQPSIETEKRQVEDSIREQPAVNEDEETGQEQEQRQGQGQEEAASTRNAAMEMQLASSDHETVLQKKRGKSFWTRLFRRKKKSASKKRSTWINVDDKENDERVPKFMTWIRKTKPPQAGLSAIFSESGVDHGQKATTMTSYKLEPCTRANKESLIVFTPQPGGNLMRLLLSILELLGIQVESSQEDLKIVCHRPSHQNNDPTSLAVFGDLSVDDGRQVTFTVQVCQVSPQVQMIDVRRIQGEYRAYQFLSSKFLDMVELFVKQK